MSKLYLTKELKNLRLKKEMTQEQMSALLTVVLKRPVSVSTYQKWEQGTKNITPERALELSKLLKVNLKQLVVWK